MSVSQKRACPQPKPSPMSIPREPLTFSGAAPTIGRLFELHPSLLEAEGIEGRAMLFDVNLEVARKLAASRDLSYLPLRKYPTSGFDLSVVADSKTPVARHSRSAGRLRRLRSRSHRFHPPI